MNDGTKIGLVCLGGLSLIALVIFAGTLFLYFCWPLAVTAFPALVKGGWVVAELGFWQAFCVAAVFSTLFKSSHINSNKK